MRKTGPSFWAHCFPRFVRIWNQRKEFRLIKKLPYLNNRKQVVHIQNTFSEPENVICVVPQGSVIGPLLFSIYINDLPTASQFETRLFADDTALILTDSNLKSLNDKVNTELSKVGHWLNSNKLSLNLSKTKYLLVKEK